MYDACHWAGTLSLVILPYKSTYICQSIVLVVTAWRLWLDERFIAIFFSLSVGRTFDVVPILLLYIFL